MSMTQNQLDRQQLQDAFQAFNQMSVALESSYRELEQRVAQLNAELAASRSERLQLADRLETLVDALPGGVVVLDEQGVISECNRTAEQLLGRDLVGNSWNAVSHRAFDSVQPEAHDIRLRDGRWVTIATREFETHAGRILLINNITETRRLTEAVNRQERLSAMGEMVASLAHQLRTPLSAGLLYATQLVRMDDTDATRQRFAHNIVERLRHLERMVNDMLLFARGGQIETGAIPVAQLLDSLHQMMEPQLQQAGAQWRSEINVRDAIIHGDEAALLGALSNLVANSLQAAVQPPVITIAAEQEVDNTIVIRFEDNGPGIPADVRERIFDPFFTTRSGGTGLGLAVVRATVEAHRGDIEVFSHADSGTTFVLRLPPAQLAGALPSGVPLEALTSEVNQGAQDE